MSLRPTASQTVGPYFRIGLSWMDTDSVIGPTTPTSEILEVSGQVLDGEGTPVPDAMLEIWRPSQDTAATLPKDPRQRASAQGFGRIPMDDHGCFRFAVVRPEAPAGQSPHITVLVFMRGLLKAASTRIYFGSDKENASDPVLATVPAARRATLLAQPTPEGGFRWDVHMQGPQETVFFDY